MSKIKVHLLQWKIKKNNPKLNRQKVEDLLSREKIQQDSWIMLPEMFSTGFITSKESLVEGITHIPYEGDKIFLSDLSKKYSCFVVGSSLYRNAGRFQNWSLIFSPEGELVESYLKMHPFSFGGEGEHFQMGDQLGIVKEGPLILHATICYDLRFPELYRAGREKGANVISVQANWPSSRQDHWETLLKSRAIENQSWVLGVNRVGSLDNVSYKGGTQIISPKGKVVAHGGEDETVVSSEINIDLVEQWRTAFPVSEDNKGFEHYQRILKRG